MYLFGFFGATVHLSFQRILFGKNSGILGKGGLNGLPIFRGREGGRQGGGQDGRERERGREAENI